MRTKVVAQPSTILFVPQNQVDAFVAGMVMKLSVLRKKTNPACRPMEKSSEPVRSKTRASRTPMSARLKKAGTMVEKSVKPRSICARTTNPEAE